MIPFQEEVIVVSVLIDRRNVLAHLFFNLIFLVLVWIVDGSHTVHCSKIFQIFTLTW